jgi:integrase
LPSDVGAELIRGKVTDRVLNPARALVGMPWVSFHTFRHTCASLLFANGKDIKQIQTGSATPTPASCCATTSTYCKRA